MTAPSPADREPTAGSPGRELDALVAEQVMGIVWDENFCRQCGHPLTLENCAPGACNVWSDLYDKEYPADTPRRYSTSISAAWTVVEHMQRTNGADFDLMLHPSDVYPEPWTARFPMGDRSEASHQQVHAATAPLAICLAALQAVAPQCVVSSADSPPEDHR